MLDDGVNIHERNQWKKQMRLSTDVSGLGM